MRDSFFFDDDDIRRKKLKIEEGETKPRITLAEIPSDVTEDENWNYLLTKQWKCHPQKIN